MRNLQNSSLTWISNLPYWTLYDKLFVYSSENRYKQGQHIGGTGLSYLITIVDGKVINGSILIAWSFLSHCHSQLEWKFFVIKFPPLHCDAIFRNDFSVQASIWYSLEVASPVSISLEKRSVVPLNRLRVPMYKLNFQYNFY